MTRSLDSWLEYISAQHPSAIAMGLERVREVLGRMAIASIAPTVITVGGTNGKGSTCAMLERILLEAGYRAGLYTSPHLTRYNERVRIGGEEVDDATLVRGFEAVEQARGATALTYFEYGTLAAFHIFANAGLDAVILEVGLGGRLDAVNVIDADVSIVVSVDLDHQAFLGNDRESIGFEKAGIFRAGRTAIFGDTNPPQRLVDHAASLGAPLLVYGRDFRAETMDLQWDFIGAKSTRRGLPKPALRGKWQLKNASAALAALDEVAVKLPVSLGEVKRGLTLVRLTGRLQVLPGRPTIVLDVAHNPHAARALADGLGDMAFYENTFAVFAMLGDKDIGGVIDAMHDRIDRWYVATPDSDRAAPDSKVAALLEARGAADRTRRFATVAAAVEAARRDAGPNDRIVVFGSFTTVGEALQSLR